MEAFILYQVKMAFCLSLFVMVYILLVRNLTFYRLNRFFLLSAVALSALIPAIHIDVFSAKPVGMANIMLDTIFVNDSSAGSQANHAISWSTLVTYGYFAVALLFAGFFIYQILGLLALVRRHGIKRRKRSFLITIPDNLPAFSFFNILFINASVSADEDENPVIRHEMAHARQLHSADILLLELVKIIQWFNPFIYILQRFLKETHEYLADEAVLEQNSDSAGYRLLLLSQVFGIQPGISNYFNHSLIKKRFTMMSKEKSPMIRQIRYLLVLPVAVLLLLFFSNPEQAFSQENKKKMEAAPPPPPPPPPPIGYEVLGNGDSVFFDVDEAPSFQGGGIENVQKYVQEKLTYPREAKELKIQGKVIVQWIVNEKGEVTNVKIVRGVTKELDQEAFNIIASMPDWKPGIKDGKPVKVQFTMPILFKMMEKETVTGN
jgi:TonB family protein